MKLNVTVKREISVGGKSLGEIPISIDLTMDELRGIIWESSGSPEEITRELVLSCLGDEPWEGIADIFQTLDAWIQKQEWDDDEIDDRDALLSAMRRFTRSRR